MIGHPLDTGSVERPAGARQYDATVLDAAVPFALCGCGLMLAIAAALYLCGPLWRLRGGRLDEIKPDGDAEALLLPEALLRLARRSGVVPTPVFLRNPRRLTAGAVTVGSAGRYVIVLDNGLCALHSERKTRHIFDAVVLHELAHIRNRDVELGVAVRAMWQAFCIVIVLPCAAVLAWLSVGEFTGSVHTHWPGGGPSPLWAAVMLAALVALTHATYTDFLRSRELCADLDAVDWGADPGAWCDLAMDTMGCGWDRTAWDAGPKGWSDLLAWVRKARPLRAATRPWHTHPGWWRRYRALRRLDHTGGPNGSCTQAVLLMGTIMVLLYMLFSVLVPASRLAPLPSLLFYSGLVLCVSLGHGLTRHPNVQLRPQPRTFGAGAHGGARRTAVHVTCVLLLFLIDPLGPLLRGA